MALIVQAERLREELKAVLKRGEYPDSLYKLIEEPLKQKRRGLADEMVNERPWPLLPMMVCEAVCGKYEQAIPAAAAVQIFLAAGDVFDDIEDADSSSSLSAKYGFAAAVNAGTALILLAEKALLRLKHRKVEDHLILRISDEVNSSLVSACLGQHEDLSLSAGASISEDAYLRIMRLKSASQIEMSCRIGALLGGAAGPVISVFSLFGQNLGMAAQISNEIQGIMGGTDIVQRKITLPVIFALNQNNTRVRARIKRAFSEPTQSVNQDETRELLFQSGAVHYTIVKMEFYKECARDHLEKARELGATIEQFKAFFDDQ